MTARARCPECGRIVAVSVPAHGDGSVDVFRRHSSTPGGALCLFSRQMVRRDEYVEEP